MGQHWGSNPPGKCVWRRIRLKGHGMDNSKTLKSKQTTAHLYNLRSVSQSVMPKKHRVQVCQRLPTYQVQQGLDTVGVSRSSSTGNAFFHGLAVCGDPRACPVCSVKIGQRRLTEIVQALSWHRRENQGIAVLCTFTCRHKSSDDLKFIIQSLSSAKRDFSAYAAVKKVKKILGYHNMISAKDTTHSDVNGWHPHYHDIWLLSEGCFSVEYARRLDFKLLSFAKKSGLLNRAGAVDIQKIQRFIAKQWSLACVKNGLAQPSVTRGFRMDYRTGDNGDAVGAYLVKWGRELATPHNKKGNKKSKTPFQILESIYSENGDFSFKFANLWRQYNKAYHGTATVYFGKGLKSAAGIDEVSDEQAAEMKLPELIMEFTREQYTAIIYLNAFRKVVSIADKFSKEILVAYVEEITRQYLNSERSASDNRRRLKASILHYTRERFEDLFTGRVA